MSTPSSAENIVELIERAFGLDLRAGDGEAVGGSEIIALMAELGAIRPPAAQAPRRIFHRADEGLGILNAVDEGAHDALRAGIERPADKAWIVVGDPDDGREAAGLAPR